MAKKPKWQVISPDGFPIGPDDYKTEQDAKDALEKWLLRYKEQGYYSANYGRIPYDQIKGNCEIITL